MYVSNLFRSNPVLETIELSAIYSRVFFSHTSEDNENILSSWEISVVTFCGGEPISTVVNISTFKYSFI